MSFYNELYKHKPHDVISHEDGTLWRRQTPKLLYPLGKVETLVGEPLSYCLYLDPILAVVIISCQGALKAVLSPLQCAC